MTDEQIIKALECCATDDGDDCSQCPYGNIVYKSGSGGCVNRCRKDALDLINRKKEENEMLLQKLQSEAIREFAEKLKGYAMGENGSKEKAYFFVDVQDIDNLVKETTEVQE